MAATRALVADLLSLFSSAALMTLMSASIRAAASSAPTTALLTSGLALSSAGRASAVGIRVQPRPTADTTAAAANQRADILMRYSSVGQTSAGSQSLSS